MQVLGGDVVDVLVGGVDFSDEGWEGLLSQRGLKVVGGNNREISTHDDLFFANSYPE